MTEQIEYFYNDRCPHCNSEDVASEDNYFDKGYWILTMICWDCKGAFTIKYIFASIQYDDGGQNDSAIQGA